MIKSLNLACATMIALAPAVAVAATTNSTVTTNSATTRSAVTPKSATTPKSKALTEAQARKDIQLDGYTNVTNLHQGKNGWMADAQEAGKPVKLVVNDMGVKKL